VTREAITVT